MDNGTELPGYKTDSIIFDQNKLTVKLVPAEDIPRWDVEVKIPQIQDPPLKWFNQDVINIHNEILKLIEQLPVSSLSWCDIGLKNEIIRKIGLVLPGWEPSFVIIAGNAKMSMQVSFTPKFPLVLAVDPKLDSSTLPALLVGDLRNDLLENRQQRHDQVSEDRRENLHRLHENTSHDLHDRRQRSPHADGATRAWWWGRCRVRGPIPNRYGQGTTRPRYQTPRPPPAVRGWAA